MRLYETVTQGRLSLGTRTVRTTVSCVFARSLFDHFCNAAMGAELGTTIAYSESRHYLSFSLRKRPAACKHRSLLHYSEAVLPQSIARLWHRVSPIGQCCTTLTSKDPRITIGAHGGGTLVCLATSKGELVQSCINYVYYSPRGALSTNAPSPFNSELLPFRL